MSETLGLVVVVTVPALVLAFWVGFFWDQVAAAFRRTRKSGPPPFYPPLLKVTPIQLLEEFSFKTSLQREDHPAVMRYSLEVQGVVADVFRVAGGYLYVQVELGFSEIVNSTCFATFAMPAHHRAELDKLFPGVPFHAIGRITKIERHSVTLDATKWCHGTDSKEDP